MKPCTKCKKYKTCTELCEKVEEYVDQDRVYLREGHISMSDETLLYGEDINKSKKRGD